MSMPFLPAADTENGLSEDVSEVLWKQGQAGLQVSGDPGSGKSVFVRKIFRSLVQGSDSAILFVDPAGDGAKECRNDCLALGADVRDRLLFIEPARGTHVMPLNPLRVEPPKNASPLENHKYHARLTSRYTFTAHLLLSAWGQESWDGTPRLFHYTTAFMKYLAIMGLPMAEGVHFTEPESEVFQAFSQCVPDLFGQMELQRLAAMKPQNAFDELASFANRFRGFFDNPIMQATLGVSDPELCPSFKEIIDQRKIVIINLEPLDTLRAEDQQILCNLYLSEWFNEVFSRSIEDRVPTAIFCEELPVFRPTFPLIERSLRQMRKTLCRFIGIHQGASAFPEGLEDPLLNNLVGGCGVKAYFRHSNPKDARWCGDVISMPHQRADVVKFKHTEQQQFQDGNDIATLVDQSFGNAYSEATGESAGGGAADANNWSVDLTEGEGEAEADQKTWAKTDTESHTDNDQEQKSSSVSRDLSTVREAVNDGQSKTRGSADTNAQSKTAGGGKTHTKNRNRSVKRGGGGSSTSNHSWGRNRQMQRGRTASMSIKQQLVPRLRWREVLKMIEFYSTDEIRELTSSAVAGASTGSCFLLLNGVGVARVQIQMARDPFLGMPKALMRQLARLDTRQNELPFFHSTEFVLKYRTELLPNIISAMRLLSQPQQSAITERHEANADIVDI